MNVLDQIAALPKCANWPAKNPDIVDCYMLLSQDYLALAARLTLAVDYWREQLSYQDADCGAPDCEDCAYRREIEALISACEVGHE